MARGVLDEVAALQQVRGHEVLEARALVLDRRPVPQVALRRFLDRTDPGRAERRDPEAHVAVLEALWP